MLAVDGAADGASDGAADGASDGAADGASDGAADGAVVAPELQADTSSTIAMLARNFRGRRM
jgi:hypothetical protein